MKTLLFDYGGTLDTNGVHWSKMFWKAYQKFHVPVRKEVFRDAYVYAERSMEDVIKPDFGLRQTFKTKLLYQFEYLQDVGMASPYLHIEGMVDFCLKMVYLNIKTSGEILEFCNRSYSVGLISNYYGNMETVLREVNLHHFFKWIFDSAIVGFRKPDKKIFEIALQKSNSLPEETIVVGDSYDNDIVPAKALGCTTIWLDGKGWVRPARIDCADFIIKSIEELPVVLKLIKEI